jgi:molybdopterin-guanine dinucleotide biosynthesis protein A
MKKRAALILAGGSSERFGQDKGLIKLADKPIISHVFERVKPIVNEVVIIVNSKEQKKSYLSYFSDTRIIVDIKRSQSPLIGALTGLMNINNEFVVLMPCDTPFVSEKVIELLFKKLSDKEAVIPRQPNGYIEPLQAVYKRSSALSAAKNALFKGELRLKSMINRIKNVHYISTNTIKKIDPHLVTFFNINTLTDFKRAEKLYEEYNQKRI